MPDRLSAGIGTLELLLVAIYLMSRTTLVGALLWTGYLGGAIALQRRTLIPLRQQ